MSPGAGPAVVAALHCSRIGAAHRRQGRPCQDFSLSHRCRDASGEPVLVLAVADGHGGARYTRSERGSRLACELAVAEVERALGARAPASGLRPGQGGSPSDPGADRAAEPATDPDLEPWRHWLAHELPEAIHRLWLDAIAADWERDPAGPEPGGADPGRSDPAGSATAAEGFDDDLEDNTEGFSPLSYGTTLGLVVIGPRWWGHTGLGDWDLVRVEAEGRGASLVSEEAAQPAGGEATCSLCQRQAARLFAPRSALYRRRRGECFSLVLSSDGIRKSCATDADFLTLAAHLGAMPAAGGREQLASALDQISREGSGDDVSVAIAQLGVAPPQPAQAPPGAPGSEGPAEPQTHGPHADQGPDPGPNPGPSREPDQDQDQDQDQTIHTRRPGAPQPPRTASWRGRQAWLLLALGTTATLGLALTRLLPSSRSPGQGPPGTAAPTAAATAPAGAGPAAAPLPLELQVRLRRSIAQLCASPASLRASLRQRQSQISGLATGRLQAQRLQRDAATDPLGALLATAFLARGAQQTSPPLRALGTCPELEAALAAIWPARPPDRRMGARPAPAAPAGSGRPTAPPP